MSVQVIDRSLSQTTLPEYNMCCSNDCAESTPVTTAERNILAERFKTKLCAKFSANGWCPYESRCMFAHGESDLRTYEDNVADKIFTEDAIRAWRRAMRLISRNCEERSSASDSPRQQPAAAFPAPPSYYSVVPYPSYSTGCPTMMMPPEYGWCSSSEYQYNCSAAKSTDESDFSSDCNESPTKSTASSSSKNSSVRRYRHDPYSRGLVRKLSGVM